MNNFGKKPPHEANTCEYHGCSSEIQKGTYFVCLEHKYEKHYLNDEEKVVLKKTIRVHQRVIGVFAFMLLIIVILYFDIDGDGTYFAESQSNPIILGIIGAIGCTILIIFSIYSIIRLRKNIAAGYTMILTELGNKDKLKREEEKKIREDKIIKQSINRSWWANWREKIRYKKIGWRSSRSADNAADDVGE